MVQATTAAAVPATAAAVVVAPAAAAVPAATSLKPGGEKVRKGEGDSHQIWRIWITQRGLSAATKLEDWID